MKSRWKISFWICLVLLLISNSFWIYETIEKAVDKNYYKVVCNEYKEDMLQLKKLLDTKTTKTTAVNFLEQNNVDYNSFQKGEQFIIQLNSFEMIFDKNGNLEDSRTF